MCRWLALVAKIVRRAHESFAEMPRPNTVDDYAGSEWILVRRSQPSGEPGSALCCRAALEFRFSSVGDKSRKDCRLDQLARLAQLTAAQQAHFHRRFTMQESQAVLLFGLQSTARIILE